MDYHLLNVQQYFYQILYSVYRRKNLVLAVILLSTIIIVASQFSSLPDKNSQDVYNERSQFFVQDNRQDRFQDVNSLRKSLDENGQEIENGHNEIIQTNDDKTNDKVQNQNEDLMADKMSNRPKRYVPELRLVHFDLKGAPPKLDYIKRTLRTIKEAGGNGILLEYEDVSFFF